MLLKPSNFKGTVKTMQFLQSGTVFCLKLPKIINFEKENGFSLRLKLIDQIRNELKVCSYSLL